MISFIAHHCPHSLLTTFVDEASVTVFQRHLDSMATKRPASGSASESKTTFKRTKVESGCFKGLMKATWEADSDDGFRTAPQVSGTRSYTSSIIAKCTSPAHEKKDMEFGQGLEG